MSIWKKSGNSNGKKMIYDRKEAPTHAKIGGVM